MAIELRVPKVGESINEVQVGDWLKREGDAAKRDEPVVVIETDKATVELSAPVAGRVSRVLKRKGEKVEVGEVIGWMEEGEAAAPAPAPAADAPARVMPAARQALAEHGLRADQVAATGPRGHATKQDVLRVAAQQEAVPPSPAPAPVATPVPPPPPPAPAVGPRREERVPMSMLRQRVATRLKQAQNTAALLTTFNEIDMTAVMALRKTHQEAFQKRWGVKLGFMSFFVKAAIDALRQTPEVNARIEGDAIVYHDYFDIGVAVGGGRGLVVPVLRDAERMSFAEVEKAIADFGKRAQENTLKLEELQGGTFTISNGGVYGSLLSTPIVNPPQSGILGLHAIQDRPVARDGQVVIRPMMYVALTYDHRIVDGREAVGFLVRVKQAIEEPARMLIEA